jgi:hypothetical protein
VRAAGRQLHPPADGKAVRDVIRYRAKFAQPWVSEIARLGNVLQDAGIKTGSVASSISSKSGRAMIEALIDGERRGAVLAELARGKMRRKIPDLSVALESRFGDHHALMCRLNLDLIGHLDKTIAALDARVEAMMQPFRAARDLLMTIPGIAALSAAAVISEIGAGVREFLPDAAHLASWAGLCPGDHESAGKRHSGKGGKGNQHLQPVLVECAWAAVRHEGYLRAFYHRHVMKWGGYRSPDAKAIVTVAHALLIIISRPGHRHGLQQRPRSRLLQPPHEPRARNPPTHFQARSPRPPGHPGNSRLTLPDPPTRPFSRRTNRAGCCRAPGWGTIHASARIRYEVRKRPLFRQPTSTGG